MTKKLLIGAGILAGAGLAYYFWKKNKDESEQKSNYLSCETRGGLGGTTSKCPQGQWCVRGVCQDKTKTQL